MVVLNAVGRKKRATERKRKRAQEGAKERKRVQEGAKERKRALPRTACTQPGLKQPGLGTPNKKRCPGPRYPTGLPPNSGQKACFARAWPRYCRKAHWTKIVQNGPSDDFGQNDLIPNRIVAFVRPFWAILAYLP